MNTKRITRSTIAIIMMILTHQSQAVTDIDTASSWDGNNYVYYFGESQLNDSSHTMGQTIAVGATDTTLTSFSFWVYDFYPVYDNPIEFAGYVMAWDGNSATGPVLYQSTMRITSNNGGNNGFEKFTFNTGGLGLTPGGTYVVFLSTFQFSDNDSERGGLGVTGDVDNTTTFVNLGNTTSFDEFTTRNWDINPGLDLAFEATLVPEPSSVALASLAVLPLLFRRRRS